MKKQYLPQKLFFHFLNNKKRVQKYAPERDEFLFLDVTPFEEAAAVDVSQPVELPPRGLVCLVADAAGARAVQRVSDEQQPK